MIWWLVLPRRSIESCGFLAVDSARVAPVALKDAEKTILFESEVNEGLRKSERVVDYRNEFTKITRQ